MLRRVRSFARARFFDLRPPRYYTLAASTIPCACPLCGCPARRARRYSFVYVSEDRRLLYCSVPKSGSSTVRRAVFDGDDRYSLHDPEEPLDRYFKFAVVRNPWDRMVSNWKMFTRAPLRIRQIESMTDRDLSEYTDFVDFARQTPNHHWAAQTSFLLPEMDFVGRLEAFDEAITEVGRHVSLDGIAFPRMNENPGRPYTEYYTADLADVVGQMFESDVEAFGYRFGD